MIFKGIELQVGQVWRYTDGPDAEELHRIIHIDGDSYTMCEIFSSEDEDLNSLDTSWTYKEYWWEEDGENWEYVGPSIEEKLDEDEPKGMIEI